MNTTPRVLVVDDNVKARESLCELLRALNYRVAEAANGHDALALLTEQHFEAVVLDLGLPEIPDGLEVSRVASTHPSAPVVLAFTGFRGLEKAATAAGCTAVIVKPDVDALLAVLAAAVRAKRETVA